MRPSGACLGLRARVCFSLITLSRVTPIPGLRLPADGLKGKRGWGRRAELALNYTVRGTSRAMAQMKAAISRATATTA